MKPHTTTVLAIVAGVLMGLTLLFVPSRRVAVDRLPPPASLSAPMRSLLHARMIRHRLDLEVMSRAIVRLGYDEAAAAARRVLDEPALARPRQGDATEINTELPEGFFELQSALRAGAAAAEEAARRHDPGELAKAHAQLASTCAACHGLYVGGPRGAPVKLTGPP